MDSTFDLWTNQPLHQYWSIWTESPVVQQNSLTYPGLEKEQSDASPTNSEAEPGTQGGGGVM